LAEVLLVEGLSSLQEVLDSHPRVLVDFSAESWCVPCRRLAPHLTKLADKRDDVVVVKVDIDESPDIASEYNIQSVPTLFLFEDGQYQRTVVGRSVVQLNQEV
jgi:thioredoxin 1